MYRLPDGFAVCENGRLVENATPEEETQSGNIILAKVDRMMNGMACAFADIGRKRDGFLPLKENSTSFTDDPVRSGDMIAVQIRREEYGGKGAYLSRDLAIPGKTAILMPKNRYIGISSRIQDEHARDRLRETGKRIAGNRFGLVMRASAEYAQESEIAAEVSELEEIWIRIQERIKTAVKAGEILYEQDAFAQMIRDYALPEENIVHLPELPGDLKKQLAVSTGRKVPLPGGGNIVIDRCEAMTVIDVNSAAARYPGDKEAAVTAANLEACTEAAVQIRLRDIAGIILIDFIDMEKETDRSLIENRLREVFGSDRRKTVVHGWTKLGIMEMTRKRI